MIRVMVFLMPYAGHLYPNVALLSEIIKRATAVKIFGGENYLAEYLQGSNLSYEAYPAYIDTYCKVNTDNDCNISDSSAAYKYYSNVFEEDIVKGRIYKNSEISHQFYMQYREAIERFSPDIILYDTYAFFAKEIVSRLNVKGIEINCSTWQTEDISKSRSWEEFVNHILIPELDNPPAPEKIIMLNRRMNRINDKLAFNYGISAIENEGFAYHCNELQDEGELINSSKEYIGFNLRVNLMEKSDGLIYVSRGTMSDPYGVKILDKTLGGLGKIKAEFIVSLGKNKLAQDIIGSRLYPGNINISPYVDQRRILEKASIFISHGGITGVREAIMNNTPVIVIPSNFPDYQLGKTLEKLHAGVLIMKRPLSAEEIEYKVNEMLGHIEDYREGISSIAENLDKCWQDKGTEYVLSRMGM